MSHHLSVRILQSLKRIVTLRKEEMASKLYENDFGFRLVTEKGGTPILCSFAFFKFRFGAVHDDDMRFFLWCVNAASAEKCMGYCGFNVSVYGWRRLLKLQILVSVTFVFWSLLVLLNALSAIFKPSHLQLTEYLHDFVFHSVCVCVCVCVATLALLVSRSLFYVAAAPQSRQRKYFTFFRIVAILIVAQLNKTFFPFISRSNHLPFFIFTHC